jgi:hypothetical protein
MSARRAYLGAWQAGHAPIAWTSHPATGVACLVIRPYSASGKRAHISRESHVRASAGPGHSGRAGIIRSNEHGTFPPLPGDRHPSAGHPLPYLRPYPRLPARQHQRCLDRALPPGPSRSVRHSRPVTEPGPSPAGGECAVDLVLVSEPSTRTVTSGSARHSVRARSTMSSGTSTGALTRALRRAAGEPPSVPLPHRRPTGGTRLGLRLRWS